MKKTVILLGLIIPFVAVAAHPPAGRTSPRASVMINGGTMMNGDHFRDIVLPSMKKHFSGCKRIALVLWASHPDDYGRMEKRLQSAFADLGGGAAAISLHHFDDKGARKFLGEADGIFVGGGETFVLLAELHRTGQLDIIRERVARDGVPYLGVSAGSNITGLVVGTTNDFPVRDIPARAALGLLPVTINPHHPDADDSAAFDGRSGKIRAYLRFNQDETVLALGNTAMIRLHDSVCAVEVGPVWVYRVGQVSECAVGAAIELSGAGPAACAPPSAATVQQASAPAGFGETDLSAPRDGQRPGFAKDRNGTDWRDIPPLEARVLDWTGANSFKLDNGQIWEGTERIPYELKGKAISITARPLGAFALTIEGKNTTIRVRRLK
jgi:dipeptidase E